MLFAAKIVDNKKLSDGFIRHALDEYKHCFIFTNIKNQIISEYKIKKKELNFVPSHIYNKGYLYKDHFIFEKKKLNDFAIFVGANEELSLIHISEPTRRTPISYAVLCLKKRFF